MHEAKASIKNATFQGNKINIDAAYDITRSNLIATTLNKPTNEAEEAPTLSFFLSYSDIRVNLVIMMIVWLITVFNSYLISFLVNTFE